MQDRLKEYKYIVEFGESLGRRWELVGDLPEYYEYMKQMSSEELAAWARLWRTMRANRHDRCLRQLFDENEENSLRGRSSIFASAPRYFDNTLVRIMTMLDLLADRGIEPFTDRDRPFMDSPEQTRAKRRRRRYDWGVLPGVLQPYAGLIETYGIYQFEGEIAEMIQGLSDAELAELRVVGDIWENEGLSPISQEWIENNRERFPYECDLLEWFPLVLDLAQVLRRGDEEE